MKRSPLFFSLWMAVLLSAAGAGASAGPALRLASDERHLGQRVVVWQLEVDDLAVFGARRGEVHDLHGEVLRSTASLPRTVARGPHPLPGSEMVRRWVEEAGFRLEGAPVPGWIAGDGGLIPVVRAETPWEDDLPVALFFEAERGVLLRGEPLLETREPLGRVFPENPATTPQTAIEPLLHLDPGALSLSGTYARVTTCVDREACKESAALAVRSGEGDDFLYEPDLAPFAYDDAFAEGNAYRNLTAINAFLRELLGWQGEFLGETFIEARVGKGDWYNAAYYRGNDERPPRIFFGQDLIDFAYDADTAAHEFGHAFNDTVWDHPFARRDEFGLDLAPNGIEESLSDFWAIALAEDPILDAYVLRARHADNDLTCLEGEMAEGHMTARFVDGFLWSAAQRIGLRPLVHILYRSLALLPQTPSLAEYVEVLSASAKELAAQRQLGLDSTAAGILQEEAAARGLFDEACLQRLVPLERGSANARFGFGYGRKTMGGRDAPFGLQWRVAGVDGRPAVKLFFDWIHPEDAEPGFAVMLRRGTPVAIEWIPEEELEEGGPAYRATADLILEGSPKEVDFPASHEPPLIPGELVYVQLATRTEEGTIAVRATLEHTLEQAPYPVPRGPEPEVAPPHSTVTAQSGCTAAPRAVSLALWGLVFALFPR